MPQKNGIYTFGNRMFIAGTRDWNDVKDDILHIPAWGNSRNIQRYQDARDELMKHPEVNQITGHSLGGSVALELRKIIIISKEQGHMGHLCGIIKKRRQMTDLEITGTL